MLRSAMEIRGYGIDAIDGEIGKVHDLFFDDARWTVRYIVVDTGNWLPGRRVLISPTSLNEPDWMQRMLSVSLTQDKISKSPSVASDKPVSRQLERDLVSYFDWPVYWAPAAYTVGAMGSGSPPPPVATNTPDADVKQSAEMESGDPNLRSMSEVAGYRIQAADDEVGHVEDFIVDDESWAIRYVVVDTRNWLPGRKVILAPKWFTDCVWAESKVYTDLSRDAIKGAPEFDPSQPINRDYEGRLYDYYGRPGYWTEVAPPTKSMKF